VGRQKRGYAFEIDVPVRSEWANVDLLVTSVQNCFCAMFANIDGSHAIATIAGELLENAIKYGDWEGETADRHLRLRISSSPTDSSPTDKVKATIVVENPCSNAESVERLQTTLAWIGGFATPKEAYCAKLVEVAARPTDPATAKSPMSGLGLVRIVYEGGCTLETVVDGRLVSVRATVPITPGS